MPQVIISLEDDILAPASIMALEMYLVSHKIKHRIRVENTPDTPAPPTYAHLREQIDAITDRLTRLEKLIELMVG